MRVATRRKGLRADLDYFKTAAELIQQGVVVAFLLVEGLKKTGWPLKNFTGSGKPRRCKQGSDHAALRREPTPSLFVNDGATVLLPETVERQKAMPSALCNPFSSRPRILPHAAAAANGPSAMARA